MPTRRAPRKGTRRTVSTGQSRASFPRMKRALLARRKPSKKPARFAVSTGKYRRNKALSSKMSSMSETKLISLSQMRNVVPLAIQGGVNVKAYYSSYILTSLPPGWDPYMNNLGGIQTTQGLGGHNRIGDYIYLKKTHMVFQIDMNETSNYTAPIEFRFIVAKARTGVLPVGYTYTPKTTLFLKEDGSPQGHGTSGIDGTDLMLQPLNKRDWVIYKDHKFTLTTPDTAGGGMNYFYPSRKNIFLNLPHYAKTRINTSTNLPEDLDTHYVVMIYASSIGKDRPADDWEVSVRGTTSFTDN